MVSPDGGKEARAYAVQPMLDAGQVFFNKSLPKDFFDELETFPLSRNDDQVDAMTMAIHYMRDSWHVSHDEDPSWEDDYNPRRQKRVGYWRT